MHQRFTTAIAIIFFISAGLACSFLRPKSQLTWQILLELNGAPADRQSAAKQTGSIIVRRLNALGVHNATILTQGPSNDQILVILPHVPDRKRLIEVITAQGLLELTAVVSPPSPSPVQTFGAEEEARASLGATVPENRRVLPYADRAELTSEQSSDVSAQSRKWVVVEAPAIVGGGDLRNAEAVQVQAYGNDDDYHIAFSLGPQGAQKFGAWTGANINNYLGVALNGEVKSIAYIKSQITDQGEISGRFTRQAAEDLALILRSGPLPTSVKIIGIANKK